MTDTHRPAEDKQSWSTTARVLHWVLAAMIFAQVILAQLAKRAAGHGDALERLALLANHKSLGLTVLAFVIVRIAWRLTHRAPALPDTTTRAQRIASHINHAALYLLMLALPLSGWLMASASVYGLSWFNVFEVPRLLSPDKNVKELWEETHEILGYVLIALVAVHVAVAAFHHVIAKDNILKRMTSLPSVALFVLLLAGLVVLLTPGSNSVVPGSTVDSGQFTANRQDPGSNHPAAPNPASDAWNIDYDQSFIHFTGVQAGAEFRGEWTQWRADIAFDPNPLAALFIVEINVDQANTDDAERDTTLKDADWFDVASYPLARFSLDNAIRNSDGSYTGLGRLLIKGKTMPVEFAFNVKTVSGTHTLTGRARLDRLRLGIGTGEWADTSWVGQFVHVNVQVVAR